ncbi:MAG: PrsW family glutamic-type intramembrane protease [Ilumatobacteraceae bacterium]
MLNFVESPTMTLGTVIATVVPLAALAVVARIGRSRGIVVLLVAGACAAGALATWGVVSPELSWLSGHTEYSLIVVGAPIIEELGKAAIIPLLVATRRLRWYVDGVLVGLAAGTGFAVRENYIYLARSPDTAVAFAFARVTSTNLMHAACTALIGAALATPALRRQGRFLLTLPLAFALSMGLHSAFNRLTFQTSAAVTTTLVGVGVFVVAGGLVWLGEPLSRRWARADLLRQGLARGEAEVLGKRRDVDEMLTEMTQRFGAAATEAARDFIEVQKKIGVATQPGAAVDQQLVDQLRADANEARRRIGTFAMLWLRSRLPADEGLTGVWAAAHRATSPAAGANGTASGDAPSAPPGGLWSNLGDR